jgi:hypothetical protein
MRERTALEDQVSGIKRLEQELDDALTLIELGEAESDDSSVTEGEAVIRSGPARPIPTTPISRCIRAPAARKARTGRRC